MANIETNTPTDEFNPADGNPFIGVGEKNDFEDELTRRSRSLVTGPEAYITTPDPKGDKLSPTEKKRLVKVGAGATLIAAVAVAAAPGIIDNLNGPEYSEEKTTYTVESGDGWYNVAENVDGIGSVDTNDAIAHIQADPANIDVVTRGELKPGDSIEIPVSVEK